MIKLTEENFNLIFNALEVYASWVREQAPANEEQKKEKEELLKQIADLELSLDIY